jgi:hypothetical protein
MGNPHAAVAGQEGSYDRRELYISQSTVRNHLSAMFKKFGVHSQPKLLEALRM